MPSSTTAFIGCLLASLPLLTRAADNTIEVNLQFLKPGELIRVLTDTQPVWIVHRTLTAMRNIESHDVSYDQSMDMHPMRNKFRSLRKEYFIVFGGCPDGSELPAYDENSGFSCQRSGKKYDLAGRPLNITAGSIPMRLPEYHFKGEHNVVVRVRSKNGT